MSLAELNMESEIIDGSAVYILRIVQVNQSMRWLEDIDFIFSRSRQRIISQPTISMRVLLLPPVNTNDIATTNITTRDIAEPIQGCYLSWLIRPPSFR